MHDDTNVVALVTHWKQIPNGRDFRIVFKLIVAEKTGHEREPEVEEAESEEIIEKVRRTRCDLFGEGGRGRV